MQKSNHIKTACITGTVAKAADRYAMDVMGLKSLALMETASSKIVEYVMRHYPLNEGDSRQAEDSMAASTDDGNAEDLFFSSALRRAASADDGNEIDGPEKTESKGRTLKISVLCGVGNNGADGVCASRMLLRAGYQPQVYIVGNLEKASWEFLYQLCHFQQAGGAVTMYSACTGTKDQSGTTTAISYSGVAAKELPLGSVLQCSDATANDMPLNCTEDASSRSADTLRDDDVLIDGIFGIGLHRDIAGDYRLFIEEVNRHRHGFVLAIDAPSGINTDTGELMGCGIKADVTITFGRNKTGLVCGAGQEYAGRVLVEDIGIPDEAYIEAEKDR